MAHKKTTLTLILLVSIILAGSNLSTVSSSPPTSAMSEVQKDKEKQKSKEQSSEANAKREEGRRALRRGDAGEALIYLEEALNLYGPAGDKSGEAATRDLLGELYEQQGRYDVALEQFQKAHAFYSVNKKGNEYNANLMLVKMGHVYHRQGNFEVARGVFNRMDSNKPDIKSKGNWTAATASAAVNKILNNKGVQAGSATAGGVLSARELFEFYRQTMIYAGRELGLGRVDFLTGDLDNAKKHFKNAESATDGGIPGIGSLGQTRRFRIAARTSLGDVALQEGDYKNAGETYEDAVREARKEKRKDLMWPALRGQARSRWLQAKTESDAKKREKYQLEAVNAYNAAIDCIEDLSAGSLRADEARTTFLATTKDVFDEFSSALAEMALMSPQPKVCIGLESPLPDCSAKSFNVVERGRARSLLDLLGDTGTNIREGVPPEFQQRKMEILAEEAIVAQELLGISLNDKTSTKSVEDLEKRAARLQDDEIENEERIRNALPRYRDLTRPQPLTLAEVQKKVIDDGTALLEYSLGSDASYLWAVTKTEVRLFKLPAREEINKHADELRRMILQRDAAQSILEPSAGDNRTLVQVGNQNVGVPVSAFVSASHKLYQSILEPAIEVVGKRRLLLVPDGGLSFVPFEVLVNAPGGDDYAALPYLTTTNETVYAPSASVIDAVRRQQASHNANANERILVIADPIFNLSDDRAISLDLNTTAADATRGLFLTSAVSDATGMEGKLRPVFNFKRLKGTRVEADRIAENVDSAGLEVEKWLDLNASETNIKGDLSGYRVLHVATHGFVVERHPQFSGVVFSLVGDKGDQDGFLRTNEIFNLRLGSPLVMLSACQTGLGKVKGGEGVMGLTRAFMYAGAPLVGVSLWPVDDDSTSDLMSDFYKNSFAKDRLKSTTALRSARVKMITGGGEFSKPYYWAPFVLIGNWW